MSQSPSTTLSIPIGAASMNQPPSTKVSPWKNPSANVVSVTRRPILSQEHKTSNRMADIELELDDNHSLSISLLTPTTSTSDPPNVRSSIKHGEANAPIPKNATSTVQYSSSSLPPINPESIHPAPNTSIPHDESKQRPPSFQLRKWLQATDKEEITTIERIQQHDWRSCGFVSDQMFILT